MSFEIIPYKSKKILFADYTACKTTDEILAKHDELEQFLSSLPGNVLILFDVTGININTESMSKAKAMAQRSLNGKVTKGAFVGITGLKKVLLNGFNLISKIKYTLVESKELGLEYLTKDS